jgi:phage terminase large subunit
MLIETTAARKINALKKRIKIIQGGTSASKTFSTLFILINKAMYYDNLEISVVAESIPHLRRGAVRDFEKIMKWGRRYIESSFNKSLLKYQFQNGSFIEFFSADDSSKLRGARRDILYINECNSISFDAYNELSIRTKKEIYLDYNPTAEFWVQTELEGQEDAEKIILTYKDNEALDKGIIDQIEKNIKKAETSNYWRNWVNVYVNGVMGRLEGIVFSNWQTIDTIPNEARLIGIGVDFGYTNDPTSIIEVYKMNETRILNEVTYQTGLLNSDIAKILPRDVPVYADSAEPKSIADIQRYGITIKGVTKGRDSINYGIDVMQRENYLVTSQSTNLIKELRSYCWDTDKTGKRLNKPIDNFNHAIDAVRYHEMETLGMNKNYGSYSIL